MPVWKDPDVELEDSIRQLQDAWDQIDGRVVNLDDRVDQNRDLLQKIRDWIKGVRRGRIGGLDGERATKLHSHSDREIAGIKWTAEELDK